MKKKGIALLPKRRSADPRASAAAFVGQLLLLLIIVPAFVVPVAYDLMRDDSGRAIIPERVSFEVLLPTDRPEQREAPRDGGDGREVTDDPPSEAPPVVTPTAVPTGIPMAPAAAAETGGGSGPLVGGGGPTLGIRPSFTDQRLWVRHSEVVVAPIVPLTRADTLRLMLEERILAYADSLARYQPQGRAPGDWTVNLGGKRYGVDAGFIRLGNFSLPTPIVSMLALNNVQANPIAMERVKRLESMRAEIQQQAARAMRDDEFYAAVRALRERKERERREAQRPPPAGERP